MISWFHSFKAGDVPDSIHTQHPSVMCCSLLPTVYDQSVAKRLIICLLAALRANGMEYNNFNFNSVILNFKYLNVSNTTRSEFVTGYRYFNLHLQL